MNSIKDEIEALKVKVPERGAAMAPNPDVEARIHKLTGARRGRPIKEMLRRLTPPPLPQPVRCRTANEEFRCRVVFDIVCKAALAGNRCPMAFDFENIGLPSSTIYFSMLANSGLIRIEVGNKNWRTVWICAGPHRGEHTAPQRSGRVYNVIGPARPARAL